MADQRQGQGGADAAFERRLLDSAKADPLPQAATREAWARFAGAAALIGTPAAGNGSELGAGPWLRGEGRAALSWLALGAVGGSVATALWLSAAAPARVIYVPTAQPAALVSAAPLPLAPPAPATEAAPPETPAPPVTEATRPAPSTRQATSRSSTLAAEVKALDAVRTAIAIGGFEQALRLIDDFHRQFPAGQLGTDAEVLAIEALIEQGNQAEGARRASRFLSRYPKDPHAPRIRALVAP